ncbi:hypothetical protein FDP41_004073 [Naegleria fowleri]|uniref:Uncharacterized protein n=1 Tax=Naegleria fowleri TaxID=5763 RepID=A0A6A5BRL7_NAEFO|nr:uncharacterized protein FDP41_004073 [Naegleria fowleri]KAF0976778.1 hypothetical protein FDP41_004073 [Naegleria fowleri]CAG4713701.1 unnamed protein product [Naegleria fowleri]
MLSHSLVVPSSSSSSSATTSSPTSSSSLGSRHPSSLTRNNSSTHDSAWLLSTNSSSQQQPIIPISNDLIELEKNKVRFVCEKCKGSSYRLGEVRSCGSLLAKIFNVQNRRFITITCKSCGHTQFFESTQSALANILDILIR